MEAVININVLRRFGVDITFASTLLVDATWGLRFVADALVFDCARSVSDLVSLHVSAHSLISISQFVSPM
ncbi:hypothetical protein QJS04_geneDACA019506 [Acorus gramineus]|uniref:Uncharacterized protein n=1 Tax=Acorus gramineus TaxID=55184 RepID=A0AAV9A831_ACOGR|nr:hypothetical protein QJS04_geneDACA019506 [Acorus gramineus]